MDQPLSLNIAYSWSNQSLDEIEAEADTLLEMAKELGILDDVVRDVAKTDTFSDFL